MFDLGYGTACLVMLTWVSAHWPKRTVLWQSVVRQRVRCMLSQNKVPVMRGGGRTSPSQPMRGRETRSKTMLGPTIIYYLSLIDWRYRLYITCYTVITKWNCKLQNNRNLLEVFDRKIFLIRYRNFSILVPLHGVNTLSLYAEISLSSGSRTNIIL